MPDSNDDEEDTTELEAEIDQWTDEEWAEMDDVLETMPDGPVRVQVIAATYDAIQRRRAAARPLPDDPEAVAAREKLSPRDIVTIARNLYAMCTTDDERREARALLDDLRARGFPMEDA